MQQTQETPVHWDQHRSSFNLTLIFALAVAALGLFSGPNFLLVFVGVGMAVYSWVTTPRQYLIYRDSLVIVYGQPRVKPIPFAEISHLETLALPMGERLRIRLVNGKREMLAAKDPETFHSRLDEALNRFHGDQEGPGYVEGSVGSYQDPEPIGAIDPMVEDVAPPPANNPLVSDPPVSESPIMDDISSAPPPFDSESPLSKDPDQPDDPRGPVTPY